MASFLNISAYKFCVLADLPALKQSLLAAANTRMLKGTVLISPEGINLFVAGLADAAARTTKATASSSMSASASTRRYAKPVA